MLQSEHHARASNSKIQKHLRSLRAQCSVEKISSFASVLSEELMNLLLSLFQDHSESFRNSLKESLKLHTGHEFPNK